MTTAFGRFLPIVTGSPRPKGDAQKRLWVLGRFTYVGLVADNGRFEEMTVSGRLVGQQACQSPL